MTQQFFVRAERQLSSDRLDHLWLSHYCLGQNILYAKWYEDQSPYAMCFTNSLQYIASAMNNDITMLVFVIEKFYCNFIDLRFIKSSFMSQAGLWLAECRSYSCLQLFFLQKSSTHGSVGCTYGIEIVTPNKFSL